MAPHIRPRSISNTRSKKQKTRRRLLRGGEVMNIGYKYTRSRSRATWTNKLYPHAAVFASIIPLLKWKDYSFSGKSMVGLAQLDANGNIGNNPEYVFSEEEITSQLSPPPYFIFGGAACELMNTLYKKVIDLHKTTDPTGDIDINITAPKTQINSIERGDEFETLDKVILHNSSGYTAFGEDFTSWVFSQLVEKLEGLQDEIKGNNFIKPSISNTEETKDADKVEYVGKYLVTRTVGTSIKIQVSLSVLDAGADHIMEFLFDKEYFCNAPSINTLIINGISVLKPEKMLGEQIQGLIIRKKILDTTQENKNEVSHKVNNHIARILYLAKLLSYAQSQPRGYRGEIGYGLAEYMISKYYKELPSNLRDDFLDAIFFYQGDKIARIKGIKGI